MSQIVRVSHPLIEHHLCRLRCRDTGPVEFRMLVRRLAVLLAYEATQDLPSVGTTIQTPLTEARGYELQQRIGVVPILRAGLGMVDPILDLIPEAEVWHVGLYRDEQTAEPVEYYSKLEHAAPVELALILDPMLATGGSAVSSLTMLKRWGVPHCKLLSLIAAPEGLRVVEEAFPDAQVYVCAIDDHLNDQKFIVPGLGDAGDRIFNT